MRLSVFAGCLLASLASSCCLFSQQPADSCSPPSFKIEKEKNMFSEQQEAWLGEILDDEYVKTYNKVEDTDGYLQKLGEHILAQLPPTGRHYSFYVIDYPENNAFSLGGSRIYVSRQLIAFLKNEDELAGLLGHEIGHIATHQVPIDVTRVFRKKLGVQEVGDRSDIFARWNELEDLWRKKHVVLQDFEREEYEQQIADRIGLYAMMRAGYRPAEFANFFDRLTENKGKKGNFFTDMWGVTSPDSKRVRLLINKATPLPQECVAPLQADSQDRFQSWQREIIAANRVKPQEQISGVANKAVLQPPLRGSLDYLQFSPDGKYLVAQDESTVFVLSRQPLENLFSFDAVNSQAIQVKTGQREANYDALAGQAVQFTPDSQSVVFYDMELRVQKWDIAGKTRTWIHQVTIPGQCLRTTLSSTGEVMACLKTEKDDFRLLLINVADSSILFSKKVTTPSPPDMRDLANAPFRIFPKYFHLYLSLGFSPDARYFVLGSDHMTVAYDLQTHSEVSTGRAVRKYTSSRFVFVSPHRIVGVDPDHNNRAAAMEFPSGDGAEEFELKVNGQNLINIYGVEGKFIAAARGPYLLITPAGRWSMAVINLETKDFLLGYKSPGLAIFGDTIAGEELGGRVTLFNLSSRQRLATVQLPSSLLPGLAASEFSNDGKWLAVAGRTSGGMWDVNTGERSLDTGTFSSGFFEKDSDQLFAIFSRLEQKPKVQRLDPASKKTDELYTLDPPDPLKKNGSMHHYLWQAGNLLFQQMDRTEPENCPAVKDMPGSLRACKFKQLCLSCKLAVEARDIRTNETVWVRWFAEYLPKFFYSRAGNSLTLLFESHYSVKAETKANTELKPLFESMPDKEALNLIEVLHPETGELMGAMLLDTGATSIIPRDAISAANTVLMYDTDNRTHVYSLDSGHERGRVIGKFQAISARGDRMLVENEKGECDLYDTANLKRLQHFTFPTRLVRADFTSSGTLLVLSADQTIYQFRASEMAQSQ
jgi:hypothetical protein